MVEVFQQPVLELVRVIHRQARHDVERAHGLLHHHAGDLAKLGDHRIPAAAVFLLALTEERRIHRIQRRRADLIDGSNGQTGLAEFQQRRLQLLIPGHNTAHPRAAGGKPLGGGVDDDEVLVDIPEVRHGRHAEFVVVAEFPVNLVADQEQIALLGNVGDHPHFLLVEDNACGVAGVGDQDGAGVLGDQALDALPLGVAVALPRVGGQGTDNAAGRMDEGGVVGVIRLGDDDLGIGVEDAQAGHQQRLTAAGGDEDVVGRQVNPQFVIIAPHSVNEHRHTGRLGIGQRLAVKVPHSVIVSRGRGQVGLSDVQVIDLLALLLGLHGVGMELPHGRGFTPVCVDGYLHNYLHRRYFRRISDILS